VAARQSAASLLSAGARGAHVAVAASVLEATAPATDKTLEAALQQHKPAGVAGVVGVAVHKHVEVSKKPTVSASACVPVHARLGLKIPSRKSVQQLHLHYGHSGKPYQHVTEAAMAKLHGSGHAMATVLSPWMPVSQHQRSVKIEGAIKGLSRRGASGRTGAHVTSRVGQALKTLPDNVKGHVSLRSQQQHVFSTRWTAVQRAVLLATKMDGACGAAGPTVP
jgi:hypothetical protein